MSNDDPPTVISRIIRFLRSAGAKQESGYDRDGAFSYHAETHAFAVGAGFGAAAAATGNWQLVGGVIGLVTAANRGPELTSPKIAEDVRQEPHYALGGLVVGLIVGLPAGALA